MRDLKRLCRARDIDAEALLKDDALLEMIPTREQMQDHLLQAFYDMYASFPKTTDFMERIVRRLAPEYRNDTVRTAILKKFLAGAGTGFKRFHTEQILEWGKKRLTGEENIREVIAFPMNSNAQDLLMGAPNEVTEQQLREVHIKLRSQQ